MIKKIALTILAVVPILGAAATFNWQGMDSSRNLYDGAVLHIDTGQEGIKVTATFHGAEWAMWEHGGRLSVNPTAPGSEVSVTFSFSSTVFGAELDFNGLSWSQFKVGAQVAEASGYKDLQDGATLEHSWVVNGSRHGWSAKGTALIDGPVNEITLTLATLPATSPAYWYTVAVPEIRFLAASPVPEPRAFAATLGLFAAFIVVRRLRRNLR